MEKLGTGHGGFDVKTVGKYKRMTVMMVSMTTPIKYCEFTILSHGQSLPGVIWAGN
jgi:hypothetical protein